MAAFRTRARSGARRHPRRHPRRSQRVRRRLRLLVLRAPIERQRFGRPGDRRAAGGGTCLSERRCLVVQEHGLRRREGSRDGARERRQNLFCVGYRLCVQQARTRLRSFALYLGCRSSRLHHPAAGRPGGARRARRIPSRCAWCNSCRLYRGGEKAQMSTRSGEFVTLRDLRKEVGNDAARLFYVMRSNDQHLDFDLELATVALQRQPGVLHSVRARAGRERDAATARARTQPRRRAWARHACAGSSSRRSSS